MNSIWGFIKCELTELHYKINQIHDWSNMNELNFKIDLIRINWLNLFQFVQFDVEGDDEDSSNINSFNSISKMIKYEIIHSFTTNWLISHQFDIYQIWMNSIQFQE